MKGLTVLVIWTLIASMSPSVTGSAMQPGSAPPPDPRDEQSDRVGSIDEYEQGNPNLPDTYDAQLIGIRVAIGRGVFDSGASLSGLAIVWVRPGSPAAQAGLRTEGIAIKAALGVATAAAAVFFPPAILGIALIHGVIGQGPADVIIAVDGERTRDFIDFENAIERARPGQIIYLSIITGGHRKQLRVALPAATE